MKLSKLSILLVAFMASPLTACGGGETSRDTVDVYVLSGQSNMEGSTTFDNGNDWLRKAFTKLNLDITPFEDDEGKVSAKSPGIENVLTSYYGYYPYNNPLTPHYSNPDNPMEGKFLPTNVGMGNTANYMGPEIGLSYVLQKYATKKNPIYFIKCAFSGSGFDKDNPNWVIDPNDTVRPYSAEQNLYENKLKPFTENNLRWIEEETGKTPIVRAFLWHQGESDAGNSKYYDEMKGLVQRFRDDFEDYSITGDGQDIAFIDAYIYDGPNSPYGANQDLNINKLKDQLAQDDPNNFVVNTSYNHEDGQEKLECAINTGSGDVEGGIDYYHYKTYDCVRMGMAYANIIVDNNLVG